MIIKINERLPLEANANRVISYLIAKALRKEEVTDSEIKEVYNLTDEDFSAVMDKLRMDDSLQGK